jgi:hypothetical protein
MHGEKTKLGLFVGALKNLGASDSLAPLACVPGAKTFADLVFGRGQTIDWLARVSPRINQVLKTMNLCAELEITFGRFGKVLQNGKVNGTDPQMNVRLLLAGFYYY